MATLPLDPANDMLDEPPLAAEGLMLQDILSGRNLAEMLDDNDLNKIGKDVIRDVEIDETSRGDWDKRYEKNLKIAMQIKKAGKVFPWPNAANTTSPILTVACISFNAEAYPIICDGSNLVKGRVLGPDKDGTKRARADRIGQHMTWQLLYKMPGWEEDTDRLLLTLPICGLQFRKTYYDSIDNRNCSETVDAKDFIINYWAKSIETAPRYTQVLHYYPYEVGELVAAGQWLEVPLDDQPEGSDGNDEDALGDYYEQHRWIDLDKDDRPEPYVVTCTKEGKVARIMPCFGLEDITAAILDQSTGKVMKTARLTKIMETLPDENDPHWALVGDIVKIDRRSYFTKYGFIPAPDGSFYDIGFGDLLQSTTDTIDTLQNQMLDAASLANAGGGFVAAGVNVRGGNYKFTLGEFKRVDVQNGSALKDNFMPVPAAGPSAVSFSLLELLIQQARDIVSSQDVVSGRAPPNQPATTTLALIEQAGMVKKGILKRIWRAFGQELRILRRLNRDFLDDEEYFQLNDPQPEVGEDGQPVQGPDGQPQMTSVAKIGREDYADEDLDVIPVADPNQISNAHKVARTQAMHEMFNGDPLINQKRLRQDELEALGATDIKSWLDVPQPPPPPEVLLGMAKEENAKAANAIKADEARTKLIEARASAVQKFADAALKFAQAGLLEDAADTAGEAMKIIGEDENAEADHGPGGIPGMEGPAPDAGVPGLPGGGGAPAGGPVDGGAPALGAPPGPGAIVPGA
jgi:chaperonin GroES